MLTLEKTKNVTQLFFLIHLLFFLHVRFKCRREELSVITLVVKVHKLWRGLKSFVPATNRSLRGKNINNI